MSLEGKVAIITGGARGLGRAYAVAFARVGAFPVAIDMDDCGETVREIEAAGGRGLGLRCDVTDMDAVQRVADGAMQEFGRIDVLVNNAALYGSLKGGRFDAIPEDAWDACMAVNVKGIWNCCKAAVPGMREAGGGSIINISSLAATYGAPYALHYATSKAAVIGLTRALARELGRFDIRVNAVAPAAVQTEGTDEFFGERKEQSVQAIVSMQAIRRVLSTEDLVGTVLYLASSASSMVTGQTICVDGGTVML